MAVGDFSPETQAAIDAAIAAAKKKRDALLSHPTPSTAQDEINAAIAAKHASMTHDPTVTEPQNINRFRAQENARLVEEAKTRPITAFDRASQLLSSVIGGPLNPLARDPRLAGAAAEGATMGARPVVASALDTALGFLTGDKKSFGENLSAEQATSQVRNRYAPWTSTLAGMASGAATGAGIGKGLQMIAGKVLPEALAYTPAATAGWQGVGGAAQGYGQAKATGEGNPAVAATVGGIGGMLGGLTPLFGAPAKEAAQKEAADVLFGKPFNMAIARNPANPVTAAELTTIRQELGPQATIADIDAMLTASAGKAITPRTFESAGPLMEATSGRVRNAEDILSNDLDAAIGSPYGKVSRAEDKAAILGDARVKYDDALAKMQNEGFALDAVQLRADIESGFGKTLEEKAARDRFLAELDNLTGYRPEKFDKKGKLIDAGDPGLPDLDVKDALALKKAFDLKISSADPAKAIPRELRADAISLKNAINDQLKADPDFAAASKIYADEYAIENAQKLATEVFQGRHSADDFAKMYAKLSAAEKDAVVRTARDEIQSRFLEKTGGATRFARQIGPTQDSAFMKKLDTIFGPGRGDKLYEAASRYNAFSKTSQTVDQAAEEMLKNRVAGVGSTRGIGNAADVATVGVQSGQGRFSSGALMGAMRRLFVENQKASNTRMQQALLEMAGKQGPEADQAIADIMRLVNSGRSTSTTGVGGAMGGSTSSLYNANEGPQRR